MRKSCNDYAIFLPNMSLSLSNMLLFVLLDDSSLHGFINLSDISHIVEVTQASPVREPRESEPGHVSNSSSSEFHYVTLTDTVASGDSDSGTLFDSDVDQQMAVMNNIEILESSGNLEAILDALGDGGVGYPDDAVESLGSQDSTRSGQTAEENSNNPDDEEITLGSQDSTRSAVSVCTEEDMSVDSLQDELVEVQDVEIDESNDQQQQTTCSINPSANVSSSASSPSTSGSTADDEMEVESGQEV